jgi:iron complex transport system substrate-binding protein
MMRIKLFGFLLIAFSALAKADIQVTDYSNTLVKLDNPAQRIVSLAPHITENLFSIGAGAQIVGTVEYSDYPEAAKNIERVGGFSSLGIEKILELKPDLVIAWGSGNNQSLQDQLRNLGLNVYVDEPRRLKDIARSLKDFARLSGHEVESDALITDYLSLLEQLKRSQQQHTVFYQIWNSPLQTVNGEHLITEVIELCGGKNIFSAEPTLAPTVSLESVLERNPKFIIASGMNAEAPEWLQEWQQFSSLQAVKLGNVKHIPPDYIQRQTLRIQEGMRRMCEILE